MAKSIRKLAVIGAGTMGAAIAACGARAGLDVVLMVRGKAEICGGVMLILLGVKILLEHLGIL